VGPTQGPDGVWYAGGHGPPERGRWRRVGRALVAPFRALGAVSKRALTSLPWVSGGPPVGAVSSERAIALIPLFACVRILADSIASLPVQLYRRDGADRTPVSFVPQLLFAPAARDNLFEWLHKLVVSLAMRGNAYGLVTQRDDFGFPTMIEWLNPDDVWVDETSAVRPVFYWAGVEVPSEQIVHIPWVVMPGRVVGLSPVAAFARTIGVGLSATEYGLSWFDNGGTPPAVMKNSQKTVTPVESEEISGRLAAAMRSRRPLVHGSDWDFTALQVNPEESQFIETMRLNASQIAAIYGVAPEMVGGESGGTMTYANVEQQAINFVNFTLRSWLVRIETKLSALMPGREFVRFNADALIRADTLSRYQAHNLALSAQWKTPNEVRALEDMPPVPWGNDPNPVPGSAPESAPGADDDPEEEGARGD